MRSHWTEAEIATALSLTGRTIRNRARRDGWVRAKGANLIHIRSYMADTLPDDVRMALTRAYEPECVAGAAEGCVWRQETAEAEAAAPSSDPEYRLAAYAELGPDQRRVVDARISLLKSRDAFCAAAGMPLKRGSIAFCEALKDGRLPDDQPSAAAATMRKGRVSLSWATLNRWQKDLNLSGPAALAPGYKAAAGPRIPEHMKKFIMAMRVDHPHVGATTIRKGMAARFVGQRIPAISAVSRYLKWWEGGNTGVLEYLRNPDEWRNRRMFAFGDASERVERLNQVWEYDSTPADVMCTDGRHAVLGVIDVYSRRAKVLVAKTSRASAIAALTRRALLDWGVPEEAHTDNGSDYVSRHMVRVFDGLNVYRDVCPPFAPEKKPFIERFFGTWSHSIMELLPGYIGHSVADRKAIEARRSFAARMMKRGEDPVAVEMSGRELQVLCDRWINACYHQDSHDGLDGVSPAEMARSWTEPVRRISNERALDILMSPAAGNDGMRIIGKQGIQVDNAWYAATEFAGHEGRQVLVLEDATDFGGVYVFGEAGEFIARAVCPERDGIDRAELSSKLKAVQKRVVTEGAAKLRALAREMKTRTIHQEILAAAEARMANVRELPQRSEEYTTDALEAAAEAVEAVRREQMGTDPVEITPDQEARAQEVIDLAAAKFRRAMPATELDVYFYLNDEADEGLPLTENEVRWLADYEHYQDTGKRRGLLAAGFRPMAERNRMAGASRQGAQ